MESCCDNKIDAINGCDKNDNKVCIVPPVVFNSETSIVTDGDDSSDDEDNKAIQEIIQHNNAVSPQSSTINIESSSDVVIGPLTQFHGPVTIHQNIVSDRQICYENGESDITFKDAAKSTTTTDTNNPPEKPNPTAITLSIPYKRLIIYILIFFTMLTTVLVTVAVSLNLTSNNSITDVDSNNINHVNGDELGKTLGKHYAFSKKEWGGRPALNFTKPLHHPTEYVIISHTGGRVCKDFIECSAVMQQIQSMHVTNQMPDIGHNFLIGGDGNIYAGRGWDVQNFQKNNSIAIGFTGNFVFDELKSNMISALKELLRQGVELKKLALDYKLVCHNQTGNTLSPGQNVYKVISKFPHFHPGFVVIE
ncbi:hypothetical protein ILUMI_08113 [Ignelater luminosus]|uniref:Uncharacterized protein n=1 Tax=Ignelater luminosus TaxID=2038154 RepID=A0A8K0D278_IGNLU|nr:hypothetical protein ILUMI_08113 [Ignelater luminosus]